MACKKFLFKYGKGKYYKIGESKKLNSVRSGYENIL